MSGVEEVRPEERGVLGEVAHGDVEVTAVLNGAAQVQVRLQVVLQHGSGSHSGYKLGIKINEEMLSRCMARSTFEDHSFGQVQYF